MSAENAPVVLAPRLEQLLQSLPDPDFAARLRQVYTTAAQAIGRLSDMDLVKYETDSSESGADLSLWEEMAPVIRDTVMDVNVLLNVIREQFPAQAQAPGKTQESSAVLQAAMSQLAQEITQLGEAMRNPSVVSDRWTLLSEVQRFRSAFREHIGNLVYSSISVFGDVSRKETVPGYEAEVKAAMTVRAVTADLGRIIAVRLAKVRDAGPGDMQAHAQQAQNELDAFGRTAAYRGLRAQDKRHIIELRGKLGPLAAMAAPPKDELITVVEALDTLVRSLSAVNQRQVLILNDREVWAACGVRLEKAMGLVDADPAEAAKLLANAAAIGQALYGRETNMDAFLRKARKAQLNTLMGPELHATLEQLQGLLANLGVM